ncbi:MAG: DUF885 family protein [Rhodothermia bacterium]|nr:DUF885 family protein [Rhodothermia bacterium]
MPRSQVAIRRFTAALVAAVFAVCLLPRSGAGQSPAPSEPAVDSLHAMIEDEWTFRLAEDPLYATLVGEHQFDKILPSVSEADWLRRLQKWREFLGRLEDIDRSALELEDRISYDILETQLKDRIADVGFGAHRIPITSDDGFHIRFAWLPKRMPFTSVLDYENYIDRLKAWPRYVSQHIELMREGLRSGMVLPRPPLEGYEVTIASHVVDRAEESLFWEPFEQMPASFSQAERGRLQAAGRTAIAGSIVPGYAAFLAFMTSEYIPGARQSVGASELPKGEAYYDHLVRHFTTLDVTPAEVHQLGLAEVDRIRREMEEVIQEVGFEGDFAAFLKFLRTDPQFYPTSGEEYLERAAWIAKQMDGRLPKLFGTLPRLPYGIAPVPDHLAPKYTAGRYIEPPSGGGEAGWYWVNTFKLESRPLYALEALTFHEAVPGHHLQIALAQELDYLPPFRRTLVITAYEEGWGLYAEWLGQEAGFYQDPFSRFGRLTYEMWRACRLVVDTGLHAMGWSRRQAIDYLAERTALSIHEVTTEIDRYIAWPGQALGYKMGELTIRRLRAEAERALGERFDVRAFHDTILLRGEVPLAVMEELVRDYIDRTMSGD